MMDIWLAAVVALSSTIGGIVLAVISGRQRRAEAVLAAELRRAEKLEDWKRLDEVAMRARETAVLLASETANRATAERITGRKLDEIHGLVNSNLTAVMDSELTAQKQLLVMLERDEIDLIGDGLVVRDRVAARIGELERLLALRRRIEG